MRFRRQRSSAELINLTPLIDVVFQLLVFFMLAGAIRPNDAFPVNISVSRSPTFGDAREAVVLVRADGMVGLNDRELSRPELLQAVSRLLQENPGALVQVKADAETDANVVIEVMEELREAGVGYLVLLTRGAGVEEAP